MQGTNKQSEHLLSILLPSSATERVEDIRGAAYLQIYMASKKFTSW